MTVSDVDRSAFRRHGYVVIRGQLGGADLDALRAVFEELAAGVGAAGVGAARDGAVYGIRDVFSRSPAVCRLAKGRLADLAQDLCGARGRPMRATFFDKTDAANWPLPWHQDRTAALEGGLRPPDFGKWTRKHGRVHAELPRSFLEATVTLRLHLDAAGPETGALKVLPGAHGEGALSAAEIGARCAAGAPEMLSVAAGDIVAMRPLTPHASDRVTRPCRRRVLHVEFCAQPLPQGLVWADAP